MRIAYRMLRLAVEEGFDYCLLLSGADYPIKSNDYLFSFFLRTPTKEYIAFWRLEDRPSWLPKVQHYYFIDAIPIRDWSNNRERVTGGGCSGEGSSSTRSTCRSENF